MSKDIRISKGLDIKLVGAARPEISTAPFSKEFALVPKNFHGITPRLIKREGDSVKAGEAVFHSKINEKIVFPSPVSGVVKEVRRGAKRVILDILIEPSGSQESVLHEVQGIEQKSAEEIKDLLLKAGVWPFIKQRPYDVIANPEDEPRDIFISGYNSGPLAAEVEVLLKDKKEFLQKGIDVLSKLTSGKIHYTLNGKGNSDLADLTNVETHKAYGPHPVGNVSTQIAKVNPINKGEKIWVVKPEDVAVIGELAITGKVNFEKIVAVNGGQVQNPHYVRTIYGSKISDVVSGFDFVSDNNRFIQGTPISGEKSSLDEYLGFYTNQVCVLEEGDDYAFFGWTLPQSNKFSVLRANMFSFLTPNKKYNLTTNTNGEERAFVLTGVYENVFPLDIYPMQLMKACLYNDIDELEGLGIYEVAPEDFALTEFVCVSKLPHQQIIRKGLDNMIREVG